jgi:hypothetical protein
LAAGVVAGAEVVVVAEAGDFDCDAAADSANESKIFMMGLSAVLTMIFRYEADSFWYSTY